MKSSRSIWHYVVSVKSAVKISSIFVAFLENTNFTIQSVFSIRIPPYMTRIMKIRFESFDLNLFLPKIPQMWQILFLYHVRQPSVRSAVEE